MTRRSLIAKARSFHHENGILKTARMVVKYCAWRLRAILFHFSHIRALASVGNGLKIRGKIHVKADENSINIGDSVEIAGNFGRSTMIKSSGDLNIRDEVFINRGCEIYVTESVTFGYDATIAPNVVIRDSDRHSVGNNKINRGPISIGAGSWIGTECIILNNVTIGEGAVVAAGSVVTKDIPPQTLAAGVPAEPIRELE